MAPKPSYLTPGSKVPARTKNAGQKQNVNGNPNNGAVPPPINKGHGHK